MIKVVANINILDFYNWTLTEQSKGWKYRTKIVDDKIMIYMERRIKNGKKNNLV